MPSISGTKGQQSSGKKTYSWEEVKKHSTTDSCWIVYSNKIYDVTEFGKTHPGGNMIFLGGGTDSTILVSCYHPQGINPKILEKYYIGDVDTPQQSYYSDPDTDEFYNALKERVVSHFKKAKKTWKGESNIQMYLKTLFIMTNYFLSLYFMAHGSFIGAFGTGLFSAMIGVSVMHDGSHGAFSKSQFWNWLTCWTMDMIGSSSYVWEIQHVTGHHLHTNNSNEDKLDQELDPDVFTSYPFIRMHPKSERKWYHKYQHFYGPFLFALFTFSKVLYSDYTYFRDISITHLSMKPRLHSQLSWFRVFFMKFISLIYTLVIPMYMQGITKGFLLYFVFHLVVGFILACMFQVTHLSDGLTFLSSDKDPQISDLQKNHQELLRKKHGIKAVKPHNPRSWAALQCETACNWALPSWFWTQFSGGLNHQIEHHLFPGICHIHYREIQQIVEKTCAEYGVSYVVYPDFISAYKGLLIYLKTLGNPPVHKKRQ